MNALSVMHEPALPLDLRGVSSESSTPDRFAASATGEFPRSLFVRLFDVARMGSLARSAYIGRFGLSGFDDDGDAEENWDGACDLPGSMASMCSFSVFGSD